MQRHHANEECLDWLGDRTCRSKQHCHTTAIGNATLATTLVVTRDAAYIDAHKIFFNKSRLTANADDVLSFISPYQNRRQQKHLRVHI